MPAQFDVLEKLIAETVDKLIDAEKAVEVIRAELRAYKKAHEAMVAAGMRPKRTGSASSTRTRALSETWKKVLRFVGSRQAEAVSIDDIMLFIAGAGLEVQRNTLRSQLSIYADRGILERVDAGKYVLTDHGKKVSDFNEQLDVSCKPNEVEGGARESVKESTGYAASKTTGELPDLDDEIPF